MWLLFLFVYSLAGQFALFGLCPPNGSIELRHPVREPLERLGDAHRFLDKWEIVLYVLALSFVVEGMCYISLYLLLLY